MTCKSFRTQGAIARTRQHTRQKGSKSFGKTFLLPFDVLLWWKKSIRPRK